MQCVILAGGLGTRIQRYAPDVPKALIQVGRHPFAHYQLGWLAAHGVTEVVYCVGYKAQMIMDYVQDGAKWGLKVRYVNESERLLGTGGALQLARKAGALADRFLLIYGDSFLPIDFSEVWDAFKNSNVPAMMTVLLNEDRWDTSNACYSSGKVTLYAKAKEKRVPGMRYIDYGLSALNASLLDQMVPSDRKYDLADLFHQISAEGKLGGFEVQERFYEIGSVSGIEEFRRYVALNLDRSLTD